MPIRPETLKHADIVVNELLCYVATYQHKSTQLQLKMAILSFYNEDDVKEAKRILIDAVKELTSGISEASMDRVNSSRRTAREAHIEDILQIFKAIDSLDEDNLPIFCARDARKLPPAAPETASSLMSVLEVVAAQRRDIDALNEIVTRMSVDVTQNKSQIESLHKQSQRPQSYSKAVFSAVPNSNGPSTHNAASAGYAAKQHTAAISNMNPSRQGQGPVTAEIMENSVKLVQAQDEDGYQKVMRRKPKAGASKGPQALAAGPEEFKVQVTNVNPKIGEQEIRTYIDGQDGDVTVKEIEDASSEGWTTKRFILKFDMKHYDAVMDSAFWPEKIYFKRWFDARKRVKDNGVGSFE